MANPQTTPATRSSPTRPLRSMRGGNDAIALLKRDHEEVKTLFEQFEQLDEPAEQEKLATRICKMLTVHAMLEEEHLYPAAHEAFSGDEESEDLVHEAEVEHGSAKALIATIESMDPEDEKFAATVTVLGEYVKHHVREEEEELFPKLKRASVDLEEMGRTLAEQKIELSVELGLESASAQAGAEEEEEGEEESDKGSGRAQRSKRAAPARAAKSAKSSHKRNGGAGGRKKSKRR